MEGESPPSRSTTNILGSFLRGRPRNHSQSLPPPPPPPPPSVPTSTDAAARAPSPGAAPPLSPNPSGGGNRTNRRTIAGVVNPTSNSQPSSGLAAPLSNMLRRRRSAGNVNSNNSVISAALAVGTYNNNNTNNTNNNRNNTPPPAPPPQPQPQPPLLPSTAAASNPNSNSSSHRIRLVPHLDSRRSLRFDAIGRDLREGDPALRIGRFTDRSGMGLAAINSLNSNKLAFRSKVVSRAHAEIWVETGGKFFIRDTKSSSGTFLNHVRLSAANSESRPFQIKDGDILQLGVDYQGGAEDIYKSVKIRVEIGREWQSGANAFNTAAFKNLRALALPGQPGLVPPPITAHGKNKSLGIPDCCICLFGVTIRQALFIAPCSHTFHYKCIRPILEAHHPAFSCPLCRTFADLEEDVEVDEAEWDVSEEDDVIVNLDENGENKEKVGDGDGGNPINAMVTNDPNVNPNTTMNMASGSGSGDDRMDVDQDYQDIGGAGNNHSNNNDNNNGDGTGRGITGRWRSTSVVHEVPEPDDIADLGEEDVDSDVAMNANAQGMRNHHHQMNGTTMGMGMGMGISSAAGDGYIYPTSLPGLTSSSDNININSNIDMDANGNLTVGVTGTGRNNDSNNNNNRNTIVVPGLAHTFTPPPQSQSQSNNNANTNNINTDTDTDINSNNGFSGAGGSRDRESEREREESGSPIPLTLNHHHQHQLQHLQGLTSVEITGGGGLDLDEVGIVGGMMGETVGKSKR